MAYLKRKGIKVVLTTGFYRKIVNILLKKLQWDQNLDKDYLGNDKSIISLSLSSDDVPNGRPYPDFIFKAMKTFGIKDSKKVIKIGDTPSDLRAGKAANCFMSIAVINGTHTKE